MEFGLLDSGDDGEHNGFGFVEIFVFGSEPLDGI